MKMLSSSKINILHFGSTRCVVRLRISIETLHPAQPLKLVTDASSVGVGAALMQVMPDGAERPIMYASRTLTSTERKYAQVEKEAAAVSFGVSRFHRFIYGRHFTLVVDNRALSRILSPDRNLPTLAAARLQRYALQLAGYSYSVELRRSEEMHVADSLSRLAVPCTSDEQRQIDSDAAAGSALNYLDGAAPVLTAAALAAATRRDPVLSKVTQFVRGGWPGEVEPELLPFKRRQDELSTDGDCLVWGGRTVVPRQLRTRVLQELHEGHLGSAKMKNLARRYVWWPGLDAELEGLARDCAACVEKRGAPPHSERHPWEPAGGPWDRIHIDYAGPFQGANFLIVYDSYTKWLEVIAMRDTGTESTVRELRELFARFGVPQLLVSDNGPQFTSSQFAEFLSSNGVRHVRVAPYHPSSNGAAERAVQTAKNGLKAALRDGGSLSRRLQRFLLEYRAAPLWSRHADQLLAAGSGHSGGTGGRRDGDSGHPGEAGGGSEVRGGRDGGSWERVDGGANGESGGASGRSSGVFGGSAGASPGRAGGSRERVGGDANGPSGGGGGRSDGTLDVESTRGRLMADSHLYARRAGERNVTVASHTSGGWVRQTIVCRRVDDRVSGRTSGGGGGGGVPLAAPSHGAERAHAHRGCFRRPPPVATQGRHRPPRLAPTRAAAAEGGGGCAVVIRLAREAMAVNNSISSNINFSFYEYLQNILR